MTAASDDNDRPVLIEDAPAHHPGLPPTPPSDGAPDPDAPLVSLRDCRLAYGSHVVLDHVSLDIRPGEVWCLLGPNGAGKTTLVRTVLGLLAPRLGSVRVDPGLRRTRRIAYVPQEAEHEGALPTTVGEFVLAGAADLRLPAATRSARLRKVLELVGLAGFDRRPIRALSGGERRRSLVARAIVRNPALVLADEPTAGLDLDGERRLIDTLRALHADFRVTLLLVTHDLELARALGTHGARVHRGRVNTGPIEDIIAQHSAMPDPSTATHRTARDG